MGMTPQEFRIERLEAALLDYVGRYGATDLAKRAFMPLNDASPKDGPRKTGDKPKDDAS